jgi:RAB6A-GEF complex partner protein 2
MSLPSNIRVSIEFKNSIVFAGEDVECIITFKNIASLPGSKAAPTSAANNTTRRLPSIPRRSSIQKPGLASSVSQANASRSDLQSAIDSQSRGAGGPRHHEPSPIKGHGRSLSILSLASETSSANDLSKSNVEGGSRKPNVHRRSASLNSSQILLTGTLAGMWMSICTSNATHRSRAYVTDQ